MKLEVNGEIVSEAADAAMFKAAFDNLPPDAEAYITLSESDAVFMQAAGVPADGFAMSYHNLATGVELLSTNSALKSVAVSRVLTHYLKGDGAWRADIGWRPLNQKANAAETRSAIRRAMPLYLALLFFAVAILPFTVVTKAVLYQLVYKRLCAQYQPNVSHFEHNSRDNVLDGYAQPATCWYEDNSNEPLSTIIGDRAYLVDSVGGFAEVVIPVIIIIGLIAVMFAASWRRRKVPQPG